MNSQIFPKIQISGSDQDRSESLPLWYSAASQWLAIIMLFAIVILFPERPAWGGDIAIEPENCAMGFTAIFHQQTVEMDQIQVNYGNAMQPDASQANAAPSDIVTAVGIPDDSKIACLPIAYHSE
ncbi:MAG: hypothetical protein P8X96_21835 [Desulfobacteraceae bacterium]